MEIQFRCNNVSRHDQSTGRHEECGQLLQANENHAGLNVRCPRMPAIDGRSRSG